MSNITYISQVALGDTSSHKLGDLFSGELGGNSFAIKAVSGNPTLGTDSTVASDNSWTMATGEVISADAQSFRNLWVIGAATDRVAVMVLT